MHKTDPWGDFMIISRLTAWLSVLGTAVLVSASSALAADYPPAVQGGGDTAVEGVKIENVSGGSVEGGLAGTGGSLTLLWVGLALLLAGTVLVVALRRRKTASH